MTAFTSVITSITVLPQGEPIFSERATQIEIDDEAAGPFLVIHQPGGATDKKGISIEVAEWPYIKEAIEKMFAEAKKLESRSD